MALSNQADPQVLNLEDDDMDRVISDDDGYDPSIAVGDEDEESDQKSVQAVIRGKKRKASTKANIWIHFTIDESAQKKYGDMSDSDY